MQRGQTATEYLVLVGVVLVIGLIVIVVLGGIPNIGNNVNLNRAAATASEIAIRASSVSSSSSSLRIQNNKNRNIRLDNVSFGGSDCQVSSAVLKPGESSLLSCTYSVEDASSYESDVIITYTDFSTNAQFSTRPMTVSGRVALSLESSSLACFQDTATSSTSCGGLNTGAYSSTGFWDNAASLAYDGDWNTFANASASSVNDIYINYSKPSGSSASSKWQIKDEGGTFNYSLPAGCWNQYPDKLMLRIYLQSENCVTEGTSVLSWNGSIAVEDLQRGDLVYSWNVFLGMELKPVIGISSHTVNNVTSSIVSISYVGGSLKVTPNHKIYVDGSYVGAFQVKIGDVILTADGYARVTAVTLLFYSTRVYEIGVADNHNYFANGMLVHNGAPLPSADVLKYYCYDGGWNELGERLINDFYEDGMWWDITA